MQSKADSFMNINPSEQINDNQKQVIKNDLNTSKWVSDRNNMYDNRLEKPVLENLFSDEAQH